MRLELLGIPDNKMKQLQRAGIESIEDLARYYPRRYNDFRTVVRVDDLMQHVGEVVSVVGQIVSIGSWFEWVQMIVIILRVHLKTRNSSWKKFNASQIR